MVSTLKRVSLCCMLLILYRQRAIRDGVLKPKGNRMAPAEKRLSRSCISSDCSAETNSAKSKARSRSGAENQENYDTMSTETPKQVSKRSKKTAPKARDEGNVSTTPSNTDVHRVSSMDDQITNPDEAGKELHNYRRWVFFFFFGFFLCTTLKMITLTTTCTTDHFMIFIHLTLSCVWCYFLIIIVSFGPLSLRVHMAHRFSSRHRKRPHFFSFEEEVEPDVMAEVARQDATSVKRTLEFDEHTEVVQEAEMSAGDSERRPSSIQQEVL